MGEDGVWNRKCPDLLQTLNPPLQKLKLSESMSVPAALPSQRMIAMRSQICPGQRFIRCASNT
jgi:hypothetical protein